VEVDSPTLVSGIPTPTLTKKINFKMAKKKAAKKTSKAKKVVKKASKAKKTKKRK
jgi:hypothetical protein